LREGALIVADNANWCSDYLARVRTPAAGYLSVSVAGDVELSMKLGQSAKVTPRFPSWLVDGVIF
jgi:hypothetical protein